MTTTLIIANSDKATNTTQVLLSKAIKSKQQVVSFVSQNLTSLKFENSLIENNKAFLVFTEENFDLKLGEVIGDAENNFETDKFSYNDVVKQLDFSEYSDSSEREDFYTFI